MVEVNQIMTVGENLTKHLVLMKCLLGESNLLWKVSHIYKYMLNCFNLGYILNVYGNI